MKRIFLCIISGIFILAAYGQQRYKDRPRVKVEISPDLKIGSTNPVEPHKNSWVHLPVQPTIIQSKEWVPPKMILEQLVPLNQQPIKFKRQPVTLNVEVHGEKARPFFYLLKYSDHSNLLKANNAPDQVSMTEQMFKLIGYICFGLAGAFIAGIFLGLNFGLPGLVIASFIAIFFLLVAGVIFFVVLAPMYGE